MSKTFKEILDGYEITDFQITKIYNPDTGETLYLNSDWASENNDTYEIETFNESEDI